MTATDRDHLRVLSVCHYILGGLTFLFGFFPFIHLAMGVMIVGGGFPRPQPPPGGNGAPPGPPPEFLGWIFIGFASLAIVLAWTLAAALVAAGRCLSRRRNRVFCLIVAGFACLNQPLGTILGVFTFVVLMRPSVRAAFEPADADLLEEDSRERDRDEGRDEFDRYHTD